MPRSDFERLAVAWCLDCHTYDGLYQGPGQRCPGDCDRGLVKRRLWLCRDHGTAYRRLRDAVEDEHETCE